MKDFQTIQNHSKGSILEVGRSVAHQRLRYCGGRAPVKNRLRTCLSCEAVTGMKILVDRVIVPEHKRRPLNRRSWGTLRCSQVEASRSRLYHWKAGPSAHETFYHPIVDIH